MSLSVEVLLGTLTSVEVLQPTPYSIELSLTQPGPVGPQGSKGDTGATGLQGDKGDKGDPGSNGAGYDFTQSTPSDTWTVAHNLGFRPSVATYTSGGLEMLGTVQHLSADVLQISFSTPVAGTARLN